MIIVHISLQFCQIKCPPAAENRLFPAPFQKISCNTNKRISVRKILHRQMDQLTGNTMHLMIYLWLDQPAEFSCFFSALIQSYRTYFNNFKRKLLQFLFPNTSSLIPFQVKNNIISHIRLSVSYKLTFNNVIYYSISYVMELPPFAPRVTIIFLSILSLSSATCEIMPTSLFPLPRPASARMA